MTDINRITFEISQNYMTLVEIKELLSTSSFLVTTVSAVGSRLEAERTSLS